MIEGVLTGTEKPPRRVLLYGTHGIGKSTWAASAPNPIVIQTEDGLAEIGVDRFPLATVFGDVTRAIGQLVKQKHTYKTVVIDSLDWLERLIWARVCQDRNVQSIEDISYAKGYAFALVYWQEVVDYLSTLRLEHGMGIILIAHAKIERFSDPTEESYDRYSPQLHKSSLAIISEWVDDLLFARYRVFTQSSDEGFGKKKARGVGTGERIILTEERPGYLAKNRLRLPEELPLEWAAYAKHCSSNNGKKGAKAHG